MQRVWGQTTTTEPYVTEQDSHAKPPLGFILQQAVTLQARPHLLKHLWRDGPFRWLKLLR